MTSDLSLRTHNSTLRRLWTMIGWAFVFLTVVISLWPLPPSAMHSQIDKLIHILGYSTLMLWFAQIVPPRCWSRLGLALLALGVAIEIAQGQTGYRSFSYLDIAANCIGIAIGWLLAASGCASVLLWIERRLALRN